jgi:hypothetical protein
LLLTVPTINEIFAAAEFVSFFKSFIASLAFDVKHSFGEKNKNNKRAASLQGCKKLKV